MADSEPPLLDVDGVSLQFGGVRALNDVTFQVGTGELFSIIGPNGAGKTSMLNCISGRYKPSTGSILLKGREITHLKPNARADPGGCGDGKRPGRVSVFDVGDL